MHKSGNQDSSSIASNTSRRTLLVSGAALAGTPLLATGAQAKPASSARTPVPADYQAHGYGATSATSGMVPVDFTRRTLEADDVFLDILYSGVCHSDIHTARGEWGQPVYPCVPGHEMIGRVRAVGSAVTRFKPGDIGGVGTYVDSCRTCANCERYEEQYCLNRQVAWTYGPGYGSANRFGGYSDRIVVRDRFVAKIPRHADLPAVAPLLCAGGTTYSPMKHWRLERGQRVGVIGIGGLGHIAVKVAAAKGAEVYAFTTTADKTEDALRFGAHTVVDWSDPARLGAYRGTLDLIISTVPTDFAMQPFLSLLRLNGTMVNVGALQALAGGLNGVQMAINRSSLAGSLVSGTRETQEIIDFCVRNRVYPEVELIDIQDLDATFDRIKAKQARYRYVIDMSSLNR